VCTFFSTSVYWMQNSFVLLERWEKTGNGSSDGSWISLKISMNRKLCTSNRRLRFVQIQFWEERHQGIISGFELGMPLLILPLSHQIKLHTNRLFPKKCPFGDGSNILSKYNFCPLRLQAKYMGICWFSVIDLVRSDYNAKGSVSGISCYMRMSL
jgi:hypothetical protein